MAIPVLLETCAGGFFLRDTFKLISIENENFQPVQAENEQCMVIANDQMDNT